MVAPTWTSRHRVRIGFREISRPVFGKNFDQEFRLQQVLARLEAVRPMLAPVRDDQLVNGKTLGAWDSDEHAFPVDSRSMNWPGNQKIEMMQ